MGKTKHTPNLRVVQEKGTRTEGDHGGYSIETEEGRRIAFVWNRSSYIGKDGKPNGKLELGSDYAQADAKLFAAALKLLEACKYTLEHKAVGEQTPAGDLLDKVEAAIAKTEGDK